jgi:Tfp pilus assembly protein PilF
MFPIFQKLTSLAGPFFLLTMAAGAQVTSIQGMVEDPDHRPLSGIAIRIERQDLAGSYNVRTDANGRFFYAGLPIGMFRVSCVGDIDSGVELRTRTGDPAPLKLTCVVGERRQESSDARRGKPGREVLSRVCEDLDRVAQTTDEKLPLNRVRDKFEAFQFRLERGRFDGEVLDEAIRGLDAVIERGHLRVRDRDDLGEDARRLRDFRARHEYEGAPPPAASAQTPRSSLEEAFNEGLAAMRANDNRTAIAAFRRALDIDPNQHAIWANLAEAQSRSGSLGQAEASCRRAVDLKPADATYRNNYAIILAKIGKRDDAWTQLEEAARLDPSNGGQYFFNLGAILVNASQNDDASRAFARSIEMNPNYAESHYQYALTLAAQATVSSSGRLRGVGKARAELETYLRLTPNGPHAENARAMLETLERR